MTLETYRKMRDFKATPEPRGRKARRKGNRFAIQKHDATRLHYDLRLELDGVFKSWAVTRGPSLIAGEKRLAVHVEDHPLDYGDFEGTIPKGSYGAGTVMLWDRGTWQPIGDAANGYAKGHLEFELAGEKLGGRWHLVRMQGKAGEKRENWLLIKADDAQAADEGAADILEAAPNSVKTGRSLEEVAAGQSKATPRKGAQVAEEGGARTKSQPAAKTKAKKNTKSAASKRGASPPADGDDAPRLDPSAHKGARKAALPDFAPPMLASLAASAPTGERWLHEIKFDGYRLQARIEDGEVRLMTRSGLNWSQKFGKSIPEAFAALPVRSALIDGEVVVENASGASDFSALQKALTEGTEGMLFYAFDLLILEDYDLRALPLTARKEMLEELLSEAKGPLRYSAHFEETGGMVLRHACRLGLEGIVSKLKDSPYRPGRGRAWVKSKCSERQEFVIAGYVPSSAAPKAVGSLVLGVYEDGDLSHVGRVGTGFSAAVARDLFTRLNPLQTKDSPFAEALSAEQSRDVRWCAPDLVAEVEFRAWTGEGKLRHASFRGLREDKPANEVFREGSEAVSKAPSPKRRVPLTHPDRIYWPDAGVTKEGLADFYAEIWPQIAPFITHRPLALLRCPTGIDGEKFFQKNLWKGARKEILGVEDPKSKETLITIDSLDGLMGLVQSAALEIHPWGATVEDWERPDTITMDLDPGDGATWDQVIAAALEVRERLEAAGLTAFVKTSGGKGLHVVSPLKPHAQWTEVKAFTKGVADAMAADSPQLYVSTVAKAKRRGKVLIDYLRNQRGATAVAAYSTRARAGASVSTPIAWDELGGDIGPAHFTLGNLPARLEAQAKDPWEDLRKASAPLKAKRKTKS